MSENQFHETDVHCTGSVCFKSPVTVDAATFSGVLIRLENIETTMHDIRQVLDRTTRLEERENSRQDGMQRLGSKIDRFEERLRDVENSQAGGVWVERLAALAIGGVVSWWISHSLGK
jgi:hypothetical protein